MSRTVRNAVCNIVGESFWGFQWALVTPATVLVVLLEDHGAGERTAGLIPAIETGGLLIPQILGPYLFRSRRRLKQHMLSYHLAVIIPLLFAIALLTAMRGFTDATLRVGILACFAAYMVAIGAVVAAWNAWFAHLFDESIRGSVSGVIWCASAAAGALGCVLSGWIIHTWVDANPYPWLYAIAGAGAVMSIASYWFIIDPAADEPDPPRLATAELLAKGRESLRDGNFRAFIVARVLSNAGFCVAPLIALHFIAADGGSLAQGTVVGCGVGLTLGAAASSLVFGRVGDRCGHRLGLASGIAFQIAALALLLTAHGFAVCLAVYALLGLSAGSANIAANNLQIETCPHDRTIAHMIAGNLVIGVAGVAIPVLIGIGANAYGGRAAFIGCLLVSGLALVWTLAVLRDPRRGRPIAIAP